MSEHLEQPTFSVITSQGSMWPDVLQHDTFDPSVTRQRLRNLPPEVGAILVGVGLAGMVLPGMAGIPLIVTGGAVLYPGHFDRIERWLQDRVPRAYSHAMRHVDRFITDFERRFPPVDTTSVDC